MHDVVTESFVKLPIDELVDGRVCRGKTSIGFFPVQCDWRRMRRPIIGLAGFAITCDFQTGRKHHDCVRLIAATGSLFAAKIHKEKPAKRHDWYGRCRVFGIHGRGLQEPLARFCNCRERMDMDYLLGQKYMRYDFRSVIMPAAVVSMDLN